MSLRTLTVTRQEALDLLYALYEAPPQGDYETLLKVRMVIEELFFSTSSESVVIQIPEEE
jgi:hypothetical protein